jgi:hypothetical protein
LLLAALAMAAAATTVASATKTVARALSCTLQAAAFAGIIAGSLLALILSGLLRCLFLRRGLEGLVVLCVEAESRLCLDSCLKAGVEGEVVITFPYGSAYIWT